MVSKWSLDGASDLETTLLAIRMATIRKKFLKEKNKEKGLVEMRTNWNPDALLMRM